MMDGQTKQLIAIVENRRWRPSFRAYLTETELVDRLLAYNKELKAGYTCLSAYSLCRTNKRLYTISHISRKRISYASCLLPNVFFNL